MFKALLIGAALAATALAQAQTTTPPPAASSAAKKELVARVLQLQQPGIESLGSSLAAAPAMRLRQPAAAALQQRVAADKREAVAREIEADVRKYLDETTPIMRSQAIKLAPSTYGAMLEERFTEDELRQIVALLESPVNRKFMSLMPEMRRALAEKLVGETRATIEPKVRALEQTVSGRLGLPGPGAAASAPAPAAKKK
jgi:hypothetical protein